MKLLNQIITSSIVSSLVVTGRASVTLAQEGVRSGVEAARGRDQPADLFGVGGIFTEVVNVLLFLVGAIAVVMIVIGGLRYVLSGGDSSNVTAAKNTILYAIVGIVVALLAYAVVDFVVTRFAATGGAGL